MKADGKYHWPVHSRIQLVQHHRHQLHPGWAKWNYSGYERKASYPEYHEVMSTMNQVGKTNGCGRAMWEYEPEDDRFGTPMALMLLPYWTHGCIGSMEGLFFESSATTPYHFLNQSELSRTVERPARPALPPPRRRPRRPAPPADGREVLHGVLRPRPQAQADALP